MIGIKYKKTDDVTLTTVLLAFHSNTVHILHCFWDKEFEKYSNVPKKQSWGWNCKRGSASNVCNITFITKTYIFTTFAMGLGLCSDRMHCSLLALPWITNVFVIRLAKITEVKSKLSGFGATLKSTGQSKYALDEKEEGVWWHNLSHYTYLYSLFRYSLKWM